RQEVARLPAIAMFRIRKIKGEDRPATAPFLGSGLIPLIGQKVPNAGPQKGAKFALLGVDDAQKVFFQEPSEKLLGQIFGLAGVVALVANESIKRIPVGRTEGRQSLSRLRRITISGGQDKAPVGGRKTSRRSSA